MPTCTWQIRELLDHMKFIQPPGPTIISLVQQSAIRLGSQFIYLPVGLRRPPNFPGRS